MSCKKPSYSNDAVCEKQSSKEEKNKRDICSPKQSKLKNFCIAKGVKVKCKSKSKGKICGFSCNTKAKKTKICKPVSPDPCKIKQPVCPNKIKPKIISICGFTCNKRGQKDSACTPMRVPPRYCDTKKKSIKKLNPCDVKVKKSKEEKQICMPEVKSNTPKNLKPCDAHKPVPPIKTCVTPPTCSTLTSTCSFDVYLQRKCNKIVPKVVISQGDCKFLCDLSEGKMPNVKYKLCKPVCSKNSVVFSVKCSSKLKKPRTKRKKPKCKNDKGICISLDPCATCARKRKGKHYNVQCVREQQHVFLWPQPLHSTVIFVILYFFETCEMDVLLLLCNTCDYCSRKML